MDSEDLAALIRMLVDGAVATALVGAIPVSSVQPGRQRRFYWRLRTRNVTPIVEGNQTTSLHPPARRR